MLHPDTTLRSVDDTVGYGVFTTKFIRKGTITWVQDRLDQVLDSDALRRLDPNCSLLVEKYGWINRDGNQVLCWDFARFINHSCRANTLSPGLDFDLAIRDIEVGEQLTTDYGSLNIETPLSCSCGLSCCRGVIRPQDFEALSDKWDEFVRLAFRQIPNVEQPLWSWVHEKAAIDAALRDATAVPSIRVHRYSASEEGAAGEGPLVPVTFPPVERCETRS